MEFNPPPLLTDFPTDFYHLLPSSQELPEVKPGRCKQTVHTKLLQFWESRNVKKGGEMMGVDMLLIDVKATLIQSSINYHRLN
uniref:Uncharacterized protein n=1 Tax=Brassica oleracea TaxID=3712 RepID=A0A3P6FCB3_BRAOL|nr:unnamed protein product [Brassica oleracea]